MRVLTPRRPWQGRRVVLGVSGGIAAYKSVQLARDLTRLGAEVDVVLTQAASRFVGSISFEGVTGRRPQADLWSAEGTALHIRLGRDADVVVVAPATADLLARAAEGRADDLLTTVLLATRAPVLLCPAMNHRMFAHPQTQANLRRVQERLGYQVAGPTDGPLGVGEEETGPGRMLEPAEITEHVGRMLATPGSRLQGKTVLVTSGPTREPLDPVRYLGNRSSGRMGHAVAAAAWRRGARVTLVSGPVALLPPTGVDVIEVETAEEMRRAVNAEVARMDLTVFAAAVADYRPGASADSKIKRADTGDLWTLELTVNPDVAAEAIARRKPGAVSVGFALETDDLLENARKKLEAKEFDLVVANPATEDGAGFGAPTNRATILRASGDPESLPLLSKDELAEEILDCVERLMEDDP